MPDGERSPTRGALRRFLKERLPDYMIPFAFVFLDELPLAPSGKIDRHALPPLVARVRAPADAGTAALGLLGEQLRGIWEELLGVTDVGPRGGFMDLGGDSLLAIEMLVRIEEVCGRTLAPSRLLDGGITIERLVQVLLEDEQPHWGTPLTAVHAGGSRRPLFFVHGDHQNGGLYCHALARHLGPDQPFYAVTPHGLGGDALPWSLEAMASDRLSAIRAVQPAGPYRLGGFCTGGILAFEMARQLQARGEQVETLLLIDAALVNARLPYRLLGRATRLVARALRWSDGARRNAYLRLRRVLEAYERSGAPGGRGRVRFLVDKLRALPRYLVERPGREAAGAEETSEYLARHLAYGVRRQDYVPGRFAGRIVLFRSSYLLDRPPGGPTAGWCHVASDVDVHPLPGNHQAAVTRHVAVLAEKMRRYLS